MTHDISQGRPNDPQHSMAVEQRLRDMGASVSGWSNGPGQRYAAHDHGYDKIIVALAGSITFLLPRTAQQLELRAGDRLDLPARTSHAALVGDAGVRCLEGHLPAGRLGSVPQRVAGWVGGEAESDIRAPVQTTKPAGT